MLHPISYKNYTVTHLYEDEIDAFEALAPYWGLTFDKKNLKVDSGLQAKSVSIHQTATHFDLETLQLLLQHTGLNYSDKCETADLCIQLLPFDKNQFTPITLQIKNNKYHLKYMNHLNPTNIQTLIHRNIWLPKREKRFSVYIEENQLEIIAYLIVQFFLKEKMTSISHIPFPIYEKLIAEVLMPINPQFAHLQKNVCQSVWPNIPSQFIKQVNPTVEKINPFKKKVSSNQKTIDPFKKKTQNPNKRI